jgi:lipoic acid synthetase
MKSEAGRIYHKDDSEPMRIAEFIMQTGLKYAVITSVTRDDLADGGASVFAQTIRQIHLFNQDTAVEALIPDLSGDINNIKIVVDAQPCVLAHNIETVSRLYPALRPDSDYELSLSVLKKIKLLNNGLLTKSSIMLGLGETKEEVRGCMRDLKNASCDILVLGQYLAPSCAHYPVQYFLKEDDFREYENMAKGLKFRSVISGPLVRSSYNAEKVYREVCNV